MEIPVHGDVAKNSQEDRAAASVAAAAAGTLAAGNISENGGSVV